MACTSLRRGEALGLRHQDLNLETGVITEHTKIPYSRRGVDLDDGTQPVVRARLSNQLLNRPE